MKINFAIIVLCCICVFVSCDNKEETVHNMTDKVELTREEYISIACDNPKELSVSEVLKLVNSFSLPPNTRSSGISTKIKNKFYIEKGYNNEILTGKTRSASNQSIPIYEVELKSDTAIGYSLVSADERCPAVLAYIPNAIKYACSQNIGVECMTEIAEKSILSTITQFETMKDSLREVTLSKIAQKLNKKREEVFFDQVKDMIQIYQNVATKSPKEDLPYMGQYVNGISPIIKVTWDQIAPYNRKLKQACYYDIYDDKEGRYAAGCVVVCLAQILSYFEPYMFADGISINWKLLKSTPTVETNSSSEKINHISTLMKFIGNRTDTKYTCDLGGSTSTKTAVEKFLPLYNIVADSKSGWNVDKVKSSLGTGNEDCKPIIVTGTCERGGHAWVLDGFQRRKDYFIGVEYYYVHANMGWSGSGDGYFLVENSMSFQTAGDDFNRNINIYPNVRKK